MGLVISRSGKIQDYPKAQSRVARSHDYPEGESQGHYEEREKEKKDEIQKKAIRSYQEQKKQSLKHNKILHARDVCSSPVVTLSKEDRVESALEIMEKYQIHHIPITNSENKVIGMVSDRDLIQKRLNDRLEKHMTENVVMAKEITEVRLIAKMMISHRISALPLINENDHLMGIITKTDLLECLVRSLPLEQYV